MKTKPLAITIISLLYLVQPLAILIAVAWANDLSLFGGTLGARLAWFDWLAVMLFPVAAAGIYSVRPWGWHLFVAVSVLLAGYAFWSAGFSYPDTGSCSVAFFFLATSAMGAVLFRRQVYSPYFNPRLRWWETAARYRVNLEIRLITPKGEVCGAILADISTTGCFVNVPAALKTGQRVWVVIACAGTELSCVGRVVRRAGDNDSSGSGYGIMFGPMDRKTSQRLGRLIRALEHLGGRDRQGQVPISRIPSDFFRMRERIRLCPTVFRRVAGGIGG